MNSDIIYEILRYLYLEGHAPTAKKILICSAFPESFTKLVEKLEKPVVFTVYGKSIHFIASADESALIYFGDGTTGKVTEHQYPSELIYKVKIFGKVKNVILPGNLDFLYSIGNITDMSFMFWANKNFNKPLILDTSQVTLMVDTFIRCTSFNQPLKWDTSNVVDIHGIFRGCTSFNQPLKWNTQNIVDMSSAFYECLSFNQILEWNTSKVYKMQNIFRGCKSFNKKLSWVIKPNAYITNMFCGCAISCRDLHIDKTSLPKCCCWILKN